MFSSVSSNLAPKSSWCEGRSGYKDFTSEMVDIEGAYWRNFGPQAIKIVPCSESSTSSADSGIISDYNSDTVSVAEEADYSKKLQDAIR